MPSEEHPEHDRVIRYLACLVDAYRSEVTVQWIRSEEEVQSDIDDIVEDAWRTVEGNED